MHGALAKDTRILIVGAGPTGLAAAVEFARRGFKPRLIEKNEGPVEESRALAIHARTLDVLEPSGLTPRLLEAGSPIREMRVADGAVQNLALRLHRLDHRYAMVLALPQAKTERLMAERLRELGPDVEWQTEFVTLEMSGAGATATLRGPGGKEEIAANFIVGADGARSAVREAVGIDFAGETMDATFHLRDITWKSETDPGIALARFFDGHTIARFPISALKARYISTFEDPFAHLPLDETRRIASTDWTSEFSISFRHVDRFAAGPVYLAGDAAHIHSPVGGRGMNLGIEDAAWLAWAAETGRLADYARTRLKVAKAVVAETRRQTRQIFMQGPFIRLARQHIAPLFLKVPAFEKLALRRLTGLDTPPPPWLNA